MPKQRRLATLAAVATSALVVTILSACGGGTRSAPDEIQDPTEAQDPTGAQGASIDQRSFRLGSIAAFAEMVDAGVKKLALSAAVDPAEMDEMVEEAMRIAGDQNVEIFRETDFLVTDLFSISLTEGKHVLLIYRGETRKEYMDLKAAKLRLEDEGRYEGEARLEIARKFGALLSYSDEKINALLRQ